jgi:hypothetical protein
VVVCLKGPFRCCPQLVQVSNEVLRVRSQSRIEFRHWDVSHFHLLPGLRFIFLDYLVERLVWRFHQRQIVTKSECTYLDVTRYGEGTVLQLVSWKVRQHIGKISRDVGSGSEENPF